ncbi:MAG TPA: 50S ribosomal protein L11 methyltransferase [Thermomicrobiales bacterium]|nr:50S ribosomal protein L11 methyltransferase [Thermomicrobiales bacterium]
MSGAENGGECRAGGWLELSVEVDHEAVEPVAEVFARHGYQEGVVIEEPFHQERDGDNLAVDLSRPVTVRTFVAAADVEEETHEAIRHALWYIGRVRSVSGLRVESRNEEDWANAWKDHYDPVRVGNRVVVRPPWRDYDPVNDDVVIELDPGMAFGTGTHPTTRLCMVELENELVAGQRVLDIGTGSGVLAIAAMKLGATAVDAVDIEPVSVRVARENRDRNGVTDDLRMEQGSVGPDEPFGGTYDLVLANIIARILIELSEDVVRHMAPGGTLLLSGIIEGREAEVQTYYQRHGLELVRRNQMEDWIALVYRRSD